MHQIVILEIPTAECSVIFSFQLVRQVRISDPIALSLSHSTLLQSSLEQKKPLRSSVPGLYPTQSKSGCMYALMEEFSGEKDTFR